MSKKKQGGKTRQQTRTPGKRLGLKVNQNELVKAGAVLVRQRGLEVKPGKGVKRGRDFTLYSVTEGRVHFGKRQGKKIVSII